MRGVLFVVLGGAVISGGPVERRNGDTSRNQPVPAIQHGRCTDEQLWLAGRFDSTRVAIVFGPAKFGATFPRDGTLLQPRGPGLFAFEILKQPYLDSLERAHAIDHFTIGNRYEMIVAGGRVLPITLTAIVGYPGDEQAGGDSYIGAIAELSAHDIGALAGGHYVVRRPLPARRAPTGRADYVAGLLPGGVPAGVRQRIMSLLPAYIRDHATEVIVRGPTIIGNPDFAAGIKKMDDENAAAARADAARIPIAITDITAFRISDGTLRYYARAIFQRDSACTAVGGLFVADPTVRVVGADARSCRGELGKGADSLMDVVDIGRGRSVLFTYFDTGDGLTFDLLAFRDSVSLHHMCHIREIAAGG